MDQTIFMHDSYDARMDWPGMKVALPEKKTSMAVSVSVTTAIVTARVSLATSSTAFSTTTTTNLLIDGGERCDVDFGLVLVDPFFSPVE
ncbi:hypothetical protein D9613_006353 [Agrocybe pediades]|uniref:Uncharacterized protein n=1 Tax=Agrocybe pediades TaxID=84607 RepID=A0A8H4QVJ5_9AGAR|nr:hypothetical protein D9613_006353 [Agrocybe pediades]